MTAADGLGASGFGPFCAPLLVDLADVAVELNQPEVAVEATRRLDRIARTVDRDLQRGLAGVGEALAALSSGEAARAVLAAEGAVPRLEASGWAAFVGRALDVLGRAQAHIDRSAARQALHAAADVFERCGSTWRKHRALSALGRLGGAGRRMVGAAKGPTSLTRRERQVVELAAAGLSAKEIANRLMIGERTVESHLAKSYAKLGVRSKLDLVRRAGEFGF